MNGAQTWTAGELGTFRGGSTFSPRFQGQKSGELPFFKVSDMNTPGNEVFMRRANNYISESQRRMMGAVRMPAGAIVFAKVGAAVFLERKRILNQDSCIDNNMSAFVVDDRRLDVRFAHYLLTTVKMSSLVATTALPSLNNGQLRSIPLRVPDDLDEQRAIVAVLAEADELVSTLERVIAKKRSLRTGTMQQLLTGRSRLPGFVEDWSDVVVANLLQFKNGLNKSSEFFGIGTPIVNFMDVMSGPIITQRDVQGQVTLTRDEIKRFSARKDDLFFTRTSESVDEVGTTAVLVDDVKDAVFSGFVLRGRPRDERVDSRFLAFRLQLADARSQITSTATYTTRALTNGTALGRIAFRLPPRDEQVAIAEVIVDLDAEIRTARRRLAKARDIRAGMLHELLTGRTRLPVAGAAA